MHDLTLTVFVQYSELKTPWVNPFQLSKAVTINNFKVGLGILYAGATPSSVTLGGAVVIGEVQGSALVHTGIDASKQVVHVKIVNLDVAQLLRTIGKLIDVDLTVPGGSNAFFIRKLELYLSTGMELFNVEYPRGIRVEADMMLFGKHAKLDAQVSQGQVKLKGSIEKFKIGDVFVSAASDADKGPSIDMELSQKVQRIKVDGKVVFGGDNWVIVMIDIDTAKSSFNVYFELVIGDALKIIIRATLDGGLPEAAQDRVHGIEDKKSESSPASPPSAEQSMTRALVNQGSQKLIEQLPGGQLQGKTFKIYVEVQQDIVNYLVDLANDILGGERDQSKLGRLEATRATAITALNAAEAKFKTARTESDAAISKATKALDERLAELKQKTNAARTHKEEGLAKWDKDERDLKLRAEQSDRNLTVLDQFNAATADEEALEAHVAVEEWRVRVYALHTADKAVVMASEVLESAEAALAAAQVAVARHTQKEPAGGMDSPEWEAWRWQREDFDTQVETREANVKTAINDLGLAKLAFESLNVGSIEEANAKLEELTEKMQEADEEAKARAGSRGSQHYSPYQESGGAKI